MSGGVLSAATTSQYATSSAGRAAFGLPAGQDVGGRRRSEDGAASKRRDPRSTPAGPHPGAIPIDDAVKRRRARSVALPEVAVHEAVQSDRRSHEDDEAEFSLSQ